MQSKFKEGDRVEWKDAGLFGKVKLVSQHSIAIEFNTIAGPKIYSFEVDGRVWCWCVRPQVTKIVPDKKRLTVI